MMMSSPLKKQPEAVADKVLKRVEVSKVRKKKHKKQEKMREKQEHKMKTQKRKKLNFNKLRKSQLVLFFHHNRSHEDFKAD